MTLLQLVDLGNHHCRTAAEMFDVDLYRECQELVELGYLKQLPARGRWEERFVVTQRGSSALGTFDWDGPMPRIFKSGKTTVQASPVLCLASL